MVVASSIDTMSNAPPPVTLSIEEKREKIRSNYETIEVLQARLEASKRQESHGMTRAAYIKMIFDVTRKVEKQNEELRKSVLEVRNLQKDINNLSGRLERSFTFVENTILKVSLFISFSLFS